MSDQLTSGALLGAATFIGIAGASKLVSDLRGWPIVDYRAMTLLMVPEAIRRTAIRAVVALELVCAIVAWALPGAALASWLLVGLASLFVVVTLAEKRDTQGDCGCVRMKRTLSESGNGRVHRVATALLLGSLGLFSALFNEREPIRSPTMLWMGLGILVALLLNAYVEGHKLWRCRPRWLFTKRRAHHEVVRSLAYLDLAESIGGAGAIARYTRSRCHVELSFYGAGNDANRIVAHFDLWHNRGTYAISGHIVPGAAERVDLVRAT